MSREQRPFVPKTPVDFQKLKLDRLMANPDKPVIIPQSPKERKGFTVPEFVRNVMGSSAGAGSGEFHVYRHLRRKEYTRQKMIDEKADKEKLDDDFQQKMEENKRKMEEQTAKKRAKRLKRKEKRKQNLKSLQGGKKAKQSNKKEELSSESDSDESEGSKEHFDSGEENESVSDLNYELEVKDKVSNFENDVPNMTQDIVEASD